MVERLIWPIPPGKARLFADQYICTGGRHLYELIAGHDRFNADLRPNLEDALVTRGQELGTCCHPHDVCTELIAREMGVAVTKPRWRAAGSATRHHSSHGLGRICERFVEAEDRAGSGFDSVAT